MADFLLEIGCEEIPARMLDAGAEELARRVGDLLERERLAASPAVESCATPRRLAVLARGIAASQPDLAEQVTGPSLKVAYKDGKPTPAAEAFARKVGVDVGKLKTVNTPKGEYLGADVVKKGRAAADLLAESLPKEIAAIYWPKSMYWRAGKPERFVRPVRWLVALLDGQVVPLEFGGVTAGAESRGHRVRSKGAVRVGSAQGYGKALESAGVVVDRAAREQRIRKALDAATRAVAGARWREDAALLNTVVNLTEWPSVILGGFDQEFLALPEEVLVTVMRDHQKYFAVEDAAGKLAPHFLAVLNTEGDPSGIIRHGNERVLRARFNDARFFWQTDQKLSLKERVEGLKHVTFQKDLGSYYNKTIRVQKLASQISEALNAAGVKTRAGIVHKAALLAKADLTTELVKEFTELQGIVGGLYARVQELDPSLNDEQRAAIGAAIYDHYKPESTEDSVPRTVEGAVLSIADKADSIAGMFALGMVPSGSKDPFALRRQANGIVKILAEKKLPLTTARLMAWALQIYSSADAGPKVRDGLRVEVNVLVPIPPGTISRENTSLVDELIMSVSLRLLTSLMVFFRERVEFYLRDVLGYAYDVVKAVLTNGSDDVVDAIARAEALKRVRPSEDFEAISISFKRAKNILRQAAEAGQWQANQFAGNFRKVIAQEGEPAEKQLAEQSLTSAAAVKALKDEKQYEKALTEISKLRPAVDAFFDKVMVMVDEERVRTRRLALLQSLIDEFSTIADFSEIVTEKKQ